MDRLRTLGYIVAGVLLAMGLVPAPLSAQYGDGGARTEVSGVSVSGHAFAEAGSEAARRGPSLLPACFSAYASLENHIEYERRRDEGQSDDDARVDLPWPDHDPIDAVPPLGCSGHAILVVGAGLACDAGGIPAYRLQYFYRPPSEPAPGSMGEFEVLGRNEARHRGGDTGPGFEDPSLCVPVWDPRERDTSSFVETIPTSQMHKSPHVRGLVNLDTWVWYDFSDPQSHSVTGTAEAHLHDLTITLESELWVDKVDWDLDGDGEVDITLDAPDTELEPASHGEYVAAGGEDSENGGLGMFTYESMGRYDISATVTWRGVYRVTQISGGGETVTFNGSRNIFDPVELTTTEPYDVISIRSDLTYRPED